VKSTKNEAKKPLRDVSLSDRFNRHRKFNSQIRARKLSSVNRLKGETRWEKRLETSHAIIIGAGRSLTGTYLSAESHEGSCWWASEVHSNGLSDSAIKLREHENGICQHPQDN
jgi:hypothetical protein